MVPGRGWERGGDRAFDEALSAPDLILAEVFSAISKRVRRKEAHVEQLEAAIPTARGVIDDLVGAGTLIDSAAGLSRALSHPIYDCLYIAVAARQGTTLVTADEDQFAAARRARIDVRLL